MLYATVAILFAALSITLGKGSQFVLGGVLFCFALYFSIAHGYSDDTDTFQVLFAIMVVAVFFQCGWLVWRKVSHPHVANEMLWLGIYGSGTYPLFYSCGPMLIWIATFVSGYIVWNIDNAFCTELRSIRDAVGIPLGFVTELHGW
jgi:dihydroceramidase